MLIKIELRVKIWKATFPGPRLIFHGAGVAYDYQWVCLPSKGYDKLNVKPPIALRVCHESRREVFRSYSVMSTKPEDMDCDYWQEFLRSKGFGDQFVNYNTDTLYLSQSWFMKFDKHFLLPNKTDRERVRSLMLAAPRFQALINDFEAPHPFRNTIVVRRYKQSWKKFDYKMLLDKFPNLKELFLYTNFIHLGPLKGEAQSLWCNRFPRQLTTITTDDKSQSCQPEEASAVDLDVGNGIDVGVDMSRAVIEEGADSEDEADSEDVNIPDPDTLQGWIWRAKDHLKKECQSDPTLNQIELKFVGKPVKDDWKTFDCHCDLPFEEPFFDDLGLLDERMTCYLCSEERFLDENPGAQI